ncbi:MAG: hypothetical protein LBU26_05375 [Synergistaceae bacterium]|nr:hypothetical protein [Synergistaceae bacterium]
MKKTLTALIIVVLFCGLLAPVASAAQKFSHVKKDENFDTYMDVGNIRKANGVIYFWVKTMYSDSGRAIIRRDLPRRLRGARIDYGMDYFEYDTNAELFRTSFCSVYDNKDTEVFREGSRKWRKIAPGSLARLLIDNALREIESK